MGYLCIKLNKKEALKIGDTEIIFTDWKGEPINVRTVIKADPGQKINRVKRPPVKGEAGYEKC